MSSTFNAYAFNESLPGGRTSGEAEVDGRGVTFRSEGGDVQLPASSLRVEMGGAADRIVFFSSADAPAWQVAIPDRSVLTHPALRAHPRVDAQMAPLRSRRFRGRAIIAAVLAVLVLIPLAIASQAGRISKGVASSVPVEWEEQLGRAAFAEVGANAVDDEAVRDALEAFVAPLPLGDRWDWQFHVVQDSEPYAFALPGGIVAVNTGLINVAGDGSEVLAVLCHELAHVENRHGVRMIMQSAGTFVLVAAVLGDASGLLGVVAAGAPMLMTQGYSRGFEREADADALPCMEAAGIHPSAMARMFERFKAREAELMEQLPDGADGALEWLSTHPPTDERIEFFSADGPGPDDPGAAFAAEFDALRSAIDAALGSSSDSPTSGAKP